MKNITPLMASLALAVSTNIAAESFTDMHKQLNIMSKIITSSVSTNNTQKGARITGVESTYLKGQGVVFTVNSNSRSNNWGSYNFNFVMPELPVIPELPKVAPFGGMNDYDDELSIVIADNMSDAMEEAAEKYERAFDKANIHREVFRDLEEERRDLSYEIRDIDREKRDLEFQIRRADEASKKQFTKEIKKLEEKRGKAKEHIAELHKKTVELRKQQHAKKIEQEKERDQYYQQLTHTLIESFCLYGNGLKAVPKTENVSLIIKSAGEKMKNRYKDKIYVFNKKDISACAIDDITVDTLLAKGNGYEF